MFRYRFSKWVFVAALIFLVAMMGCIFYIVVTQTPSTTITLTSGLDEAGLPIDEINVFDQNTEVIYCFIELRGLFGQRLRRTLLVKWYYGSEQIASHYVRTNRNEPKTIWLEPQLDESFRQGNYFVEIIAPPRIIKTIRFEVE